MKINDLKIGVKLVITLMSVTIIIVLMLGTYAYLKNKTRIRNYSDEYIKGVINGLDEYINYHFLDYRSNQLKSNDLIVKLINEKGDINSITSDLLNQINETHRPVIITQNGEARAVLQDPESYEEMRKALALLRILAIGEEDIRKGRLKEQEEVFSNIEKKLKKYEK